MSASDYDGKERRQGPPDRRTDADRRDSERLANEDPRRQRNDRRDRPEDDQADDQ